ncbi:MAG TPA: phytase [Thermoanaerobaculia bacterium]|jgi:3-phytase|nr:phytase [Thermoanaerobaculia bacterium]
MSRSQNFLVLAAVAVVAATACVSPTTAPNAVRPVVVTEQVAGDSDDPAIWIHPTDASQSLILGTDKSGGLYTFDLSGKILADRTQTGLSRPNNVDIQQGVVLDGKTLDVAIVTERDGGRVRMYRLPEVVSIDGGGVEVFAGDPPDLRTPMGVALYHRPSDGALFAIVSRKTGPAEGYLWQYRITGNGSGGVSFEKVRQFGAFSGGEGEIEAIAIDDESGYVYYSDEWAGVRKYAADPDAADANKPLAVLGEKGFREDREGISIYKTGPRTGYILVSDQQANMFRVYPREGTASDPHAQAEIAAIPVSTLESDGSEVTSIALGPNFPKGLFVAMSEGKVFQLYRWEDLEARLKGTP